MKCLENPAQHGSRASGQSGFDAMHQVDKVAVGVGEEYQPVALVIDRLVEELDAVPAQMRLRGVEILHQDGQVADAGVFHLLCARDRLRTE